MAMYNGDSSDLLDQIIKRYPAIFAVTDEAVRLGWQLANKFLASSATMPGPFRIRERRPIQNAYAVGYCRQLLQPFEDEGVVKWIEEAETSTFRLEPDLAFRIKKTDHEGRPSNITTGRNNRILSRNQWSLFGSQQEILRDLPTEDRWFTIGFVPDEFDIGLDVCGLTMSNGPILPFEQIDDESLASLAPAAWPSIVEARRLLA
jgi:hypothetical protein